MKKGLGLFIGTVILILVGFLEFSWADVQGPCEQDLQTYCSEVRPGEGRVAECLDRYAERLSAECRDYSQKSSQALKHLQDACSDDAQDYCRDVKTSFKRIVHCLRERINEISPDCRGHSRRQQLLLNGVVLIV